MVSAMTLYVDLAKSAKVVNALINAKTGRRAILQMNVWVNRLLGVLSGNGSHTRIPMFVAT
jgi:hypothetical protein